MALGCQGIEVAIDLADYFGRERVTEHLVHVDGAQNRQHRGLLPPCMFGLSRKIEQ